MIIRGATHGSRLAVIFAFLFVVTACGGGGGGGDNFYNPPDDDVGLDIALYDAAGNKTSTVTSAAPGTIRVFVRKGGANIVVSAATTAGTLLPSTGTSLTDSSSNATFTLLVEPGTEKGAGTVTASASTKDGELTTTLTFEIGESGLRLGYFDADGDFIENAIAIEPETTLAAEGRAQLSVAVVNKRGVLVNTAESVIFSSGCLSTGLSTLDPVSPITTSNGLVITTYSAKGCDGIDEISASLDGAVAQAFGRVSIATAEAGGLLFESLEPSIIAVRGTGGFSQRRQSSDVSFKVVSNIGFPIQGVRVKFSLTSTAGGAALSVDSILSTSNGLATTTVFAGDVSSVVRVIATIEAEDGSNEEISNISDAITISSGLPVQSGMSLSLKAGEGYVVENGMTQDGVERTLTVKMRDEFNNPVPNGTEANFETEFGNVDGLCKTGVENGASLPPGTAPAEGECSVLWTSGNPRTPEGNENREAVQTIQNNPRYNCPSHTGNGGPCPDDLGYTRGGRSTVLVYGLGNATFSDSNGNWVMDPDEKDDFDNLPEAFLDKNEDDVYTPTLCDAGGGTTAQCRAGSEETYIDLNLNGQYDLNNDPAWYRGLACPLEGDGVYCFRKPVNVREDTVLILSAPDIAGSQIWDMILVRGRTVAGAVEENTTYKAYISDFYNNSPPAGSTVKVTAGGGCRITGAQEFTVGDSQSPGAFTISVTAGPSIITPDDPGAVSITLNPPTGAPYTEDFPCNDLCAVDDPPDACTPPV
jgi:hypothetical protein